MLELLRNVAEKSQLQMSGSDGRGEPSVDVSATSGSDDGAVEGSVEDSTATVVVSTTTGAVEGAADCSTETVVFCEDPHAPINTAATKNDAMRRVGGIAFCISHFTRFHRQVIAKAENGGCYESLSKLAL